MHPHRCGKGRRRLLPALLVATILAVTSVQAPAPTARAQIDGDFSSTYRVDVAAGEVQVQITIPAVSAGPQVLAVHDNAAGIEAAVDGRAVSVAVGNASDFERQVSFTVAQPGELVLSYLLPSAPARVEAYTRVNPAYVSFLVQTDPRLGSGRVRVEMPPGFRSSARSDSIDLVARTDDGEIWEAERARGMFFDMVARNEAGLARTLVEVGGRTITIAGWADDPEWIEFAVATVTEGVPLLMEATGQPMPETDLVILESTLPSEAGYGGWYSVWESEIEVGDTLDQALLLHEIAHAWFHNENLEERWISEGWAEDMSRVVYARLSGDDEGPADLGPDAPGTTGLATWSFDADWETTINRYEASWLVMRTLREEIGDDGLREVLAAIFEGRTAYHVDGDPAIFPKTGSARLLDLFENVGGSERAGALFRRHVFPEASAGRLDQRDRVRAEYADLVSASSQPAPADIRDRMHHWRFEEATLLIERALPVAVRLGELEARAAELGTTVPPAIIEDYLASARRPEALLAALDSLAERLDDVAAIADPDERAAQLAASDGRGATGTLAAAVPDDGPPWPIIGGLVAALCLVAFALFVSRTMRAAREMESRVKHNLDSWRP